MASYWECVYCTYINDYGQNCFVCGAWVCDQCTYNNSGSTQCSACDSAKPAVANNKSEKPEEEAAKNPTTESPTAKSLRDAANAAGEKFECDCETGAFCGKHNRVMIFQEYPTKPSSGYPGIDDMRYIGAIIPAHRVFEMINGPMVSRMMTRDYTQSIAGVSITMDSKHIITQLVVTKTMFGLEVSGPTLGVMKKLYDHVMKTRHPLCMEVTIADGTDETKSDIGYLQSHGIILAIIPGEWVSTQYQSTGDHLNKMFPEKSNLGRFILGKIYLVDPNSSSTIANHNSQEIENAIRSLLPADDRFAFIPQKVWLNKKSYYINGSYSSIGISSGWCRTISVLIAGMITRRDMPKHPEDVLEYIASYPARLRIIMYEAVIRYVVFHIYTAKDCEKFISDRENRARKYQESLKIRNARATISK